MKSKAKKQYIPRIMPSISTSSKKFLTKKDKANNRRALNRFEWA